MIKIILASTNPHKVEEINLINKNPEIIFKSINCDFNPIENGKTFYENALIKAQTASKLTGNYCLADDSGLCIDALDGRPGIFSARYANTPQERIDRVLKELGGIDMQARAAHFTCAMVLTSPDGDMIHYEEGRVNGFIDFEPKGQNGFGYDPIFFMPEFKKTMAELPEETKNSVSHRSNALRPMLSAIEKYFSKF